MGLSLKIEVSIADGAYMRNAFFGGLWFKSITIDCVPPDALVEDRRAHVIRLLENIRLVWDDCEEEKHLHACEDWEKMLADLRHADFTKEFKHEGLIDVIITPVVC